MKNSITLKKVFFFILFLGFGCETEKEKPFPEQEDFTLS